MIYQRTCYESGLSTLYNSANPADDADAYYGRLDREAAKRPVCNRCEEHITSEFLFDMDGVLFCEDCLDECVEDVSDHELHVDSEDENAVSHIFCVSCRRHLRMNEQFYDLPDGVYCESCKRNAISAVELYMGPRW